MAALSNPVGAKPKLTPQQRLDKLLEGRVAGKPVDCLSSIDTRDVEVIDKTAIVYSTGNTIYVNRTTNPASLDSDDVLVTKIWGSGPCKLDTIQLHDRSMGSWRGFVGLEQFVPYRKVAKPG
jgi:hypothetical protein